MATPRLRLRRGTAAPSGSIALVGEPFVDTTNKNLYVADGTSSFFLIGGSSYTSRVDNFLTDHTGSASAKVEIGDADGSQAVTLTVPTSLTAAYTLTLPANDGDSGQVLQTDGSGGLSWVNQSSGFANWVLSDGSNSQTINSTDTVTVTGGSGISSLVSATDTVTLALDIAELTNEAAIADGDELPFYDTSVTANRKVTASNLALYTLQEASGDVTFNASGVAAIGSGVIVDGDISASAEIAVSKLANGTARQLLQTDSAGTGVEWATNIDVPGTLDVTGNATFDLNVTVQGNLTVNGTTTTIATTNTVVSDRLIELANGTTGSPTADAGLVIERGDSSNIFLGYDEGADVFVVGTTTGTGASTDLAPTPITFLAGALNIADTASSGASEAVVSYLAADGLFAGAAAGRYLQNVTVDCGTY